VDLSYTTVVTDTEIRTLAERASRLRRLCVLECPQLSDVMVLSVSQFSKDLQALSLSRGSLQFKVTDVSLLALGERAKALHMLDLSGCDFITDVGISWIASGCEYLGELLVPGCTKVRHTYSKACDYACALDYAFLQQTRISTFFVLT
jgi:hypothetical protein